MNIVLIDDSATNLIVLRNLCARIVGSECTSYTDAEHALQHLLTHDAALIILDYSMPKITGIELVKRLRVSRRHATTPIVMVTGSNEQAVHTRAIEVGVTELFVKPIRAADYIGRLEKLLTPHRAVA